jgi:uncharacterized protein DUF6455
MNSMALLIFIIGVSFFTVAVSLLYAIRKNFLLGKSFRLGYLENITNLRFGQMIKKHGLNTNQFIHRTPITDIEKQLNNCHSCSKTSECDRVLQKTVVKESELTFCPNHTALAQQN